MNALLALLAEDYTDDKGLDFIEIILIGFVVIGIPLIIFAIWVSKSDSPIAEKIRQIDAQVGDYDLTQDQIDNAYGGLKYEMKQYYQRENSRPYND